jgi:hypothetical protein
LQLFFFSPSILGLFLFFIFLQLSGDFLAFCRSDRPERRLPPPLPEGDNEDQRDWREVLGGKGGDEGCLGGEGKRRSKRGILGEGKRKADIKGSYPEEQKKKKKRWKSYKIRKKEKNRPKKKPQRKV